MIVCSLLLSCGDGGGTKPPEPPPTQVPGKVMLSAPNNNATDQPTTLAFSWQPVAEATGYRVQVSENANVSSPVVDVENLTATQHTATLDPGTTYHWRVQASNSVGNGDWSNVWMFGTKLAKVTLSAPRDNAMSQDTSLTFSWQPVNGATAYQIQVSTAANFSSTVVDVQDITTTQHTATLQASMSYHWRVRASNSGGSNGEWSDVRTFTTVGGTFSGNLTFTTQAQIDTFSYTGVTGTLRIEESSSGGITNLNRLSNLTSVGGSLAIVSNSALTSLEGLESITSVGGELDIVSNLGLTSLEGLNNVTSAGALLIRTNLLLTSLSALSNVTSVGGNLEISVNVKLPSLAGLENLTSLGGDLTIQNNSVLTNLCAVSHLVGTGKQVSSGEYTVQLNEYNPTYIEIQTTGKGGCEIPPTPEKVVLSSPDSGATGQALPLTLSWQAMDFVRTYQIQVSTNSSFTSTVVNVSNLTTTQYTTTALNYNANYFWRVRASNDAGTGDWSDVRSFRIQPLSQVTVTLSSPNNGATDQSLPVTLRWEAVTNITRYRVQVATTSNFVTGTTRSHVLSGTQYTVPSDFINRNTTYYWHVRVISGSNTGPWSVAWSFGTGN